MKSEDIVILTENMKVSFVGQKAMFIDIVVEKEIEYQILSKDGNDYVNPITLPLRFDELYKPHASRIRNELRLFDDVTISAFEARVIHPDGRTEEIEINKDIVEHKIVLETDRFGLIYSYNFSFEELEPDDVLKISYKYSFPFRYNWERLFSTRVFLDTRIPRKKFDLTWSHHYYLEVDTNYINGATPKLDTANNYVYLSWHFENQPGCLDEPGSRPHTNVPWFSFSPKPYEFLYEHYNSFEEEFIPFWYFLSYYREARIRNAIVDFQIGTKDKDNLKFEKIAKKYVEMSPEDSIGINRLRYFQRYVVDSTKYDNAYKLLNREEEYKRDHSGSELAGGIIKEPFKEFIYASMIPKMGNMFFTAYPSDTRSGYIGQEYYAPMLDNEFMFASILKNNTLAYVMPKSDIRNLYCEELPFYYENTPVMLLYSYDFAGYKRNFADVLRVVNTPSSNVRENYRKVNSMAKINLIKDEILFTTKISLAGQYSTLTRSIYQEGVSDNTINPLYLEKIWEIGDSVKVVDISIGNNKYFFPFKTSLDATYMKRGLIQKNENLFTVDLSGWIKHVIWDEFKNEFRFTDFYSDFTGHDTFAYMLEFDQAVSLVEVSENTDIDNDFGTYKFSIKQLSENKLLLSSYFMIKSHLVKKENIDQVANIFNTIEENNNVILKLKILDQ